MIALLLRTCYHESMKKLTFTYYDWEKFATFLDSLPAKDAQKLVQLIREIEQYGLQTSERQEWVKKLENNLYEIRSRQGSNIQRVIYFQIDQSQYMITHGFTKKTQKTPIKEINRGIRLRNTYFHERRNGHE